MQNNRLTPGLVKLIALVIILNFIATVTSTINLKREFDSKIVYTPDHKMIGDRFWKNTESVRVDGNRAKVPYQLPGPLDSWAGGDVKKIIIPAPFAEATTFTINILDSHDESPPIFEVSIGEKLIATIELAKGRGVRPHEWATKGKRSKYSFTIPAQSERGEGSEIVISSVSGSWSVIGSITAQIYPPVWKVEATLFGWGITILFLIFMAWVYFGSMIRLLQLHKLATATLVVAITIPSVGYVYINKMLTNGVISYNIIHDNDGYFLFRATNKMVMNRLPDGYSQETALAALKDYVYLTAQPAGADRQKAAYNLFMYGVAWCDQSSWIYLHLISPLKVRAYIAYLFDTNGKSPHTVSFIDPGEGSRQGDIAYLMANARVTDTYNGVTFRAQNNSYASPTEICEQNFTPNRGSDIAKLFCQTPTIHGSNKQMVTNPAQESWFYKRVFPYLPEFALLQIAKFGIRHHPGMEKAETSYLLARMDHLFFNLGEAKKGYLEVEKRFEGTEWADLAEHYRERLHYLSQCFSDKGYTGILPEKQAWDSVAYPDGRNN